MQYFDHSFTLDYPMNLIVSSDHFINFNSSVDTKYWTGIYEKVPNVVLNGRPMWIDSDLTSVIVFGGKEKMHFSICMLILKHISVENKWIVGDTAQQNRRFVSPTTSSFLLPENVFKNRFVKKPRQKKVTKKSRKHANMYRVWD